MVPESVEFSCERIPTDTSDHVVEDHVVQYRFAAAGAEPIDCNM